MAARGREYYTSCSERERGDHTRALLPLPPDRDHFRAGRPRHFTSSQPKIRHRASMHLRGCCDLGGLNSFWRPHTIWSRMLSLTSISSSSPTAAAAADLSDKWSFLDISHPSSTCSMRRSIVQGGPFRFNFAATSADPLEGHPIAIKKPGPAALPCSPRPAGQFTYQLISSCHKR